MALDTAAVGEPRLWSRIRPPGLSARILARIQVSPEARAARAVVLKSADPDECGDVAGGRRKRAVGPDILNAAVRTVRIPGHMPGAAGGIMVYPVENIGAG